MYNVAISSFYCKSLSLNNKKNELQFGDEPLVRER